MKNWIKNLASWYRGRKVIRYYHSENFGDTTEYIELRKGILTCVSRAGKRDSCYIPMMLAESFVEQGLWVER